MTRIDPNRIDNKRDHIEIPSIGDAFWVWLKIGVFSFGGPAGQIALMHRVIVEELKWIDDARFLHALNYCMLLPGPEAQQLATYIGWLMHRTLGGLTAGLLFIFPGALVMLGLSMAYVIYADAPILIAAFTGIKAAVLVVVLEAVIRIGKRSLKSPLMIAIASLAFVAIFGFSIPFPFIIIGAAIIGIVARVLLPDLFLPDANQTSVNITNPCLIDKMSAIGLLNHTKPNIKRALKFLFILVFLWIFPIAILFIFMGPKDVFAQQSLFFSKLAVVSFGGAYAVLAYMAQQAVDLYGWLSPNQMLDGLGLAETTPGPLILVTQFVGFLGAYSQSNLDNPVVSGILGASLTIWVTFTPCFLWIFLGAPYIEQLRNNVILTAALSSITAAVVGVILNLAVWFGIHVSFGKIKETSIAGFSLPIPDLTTAEPLTIGLTIFAATMIFGFYQSVIRTLLACSVLGMLFSFY